MTGAARGIGEAVAVALAREGARVMATDLAEPDGSPPCPPGGMYRRLDVREESDWMGAMQDALDRWGRLDVLVNNAGITGFEAGLVPHDPENASLEDWHAVHRTNLDGVFPGCKHAIRAMRRTDEGSMIVNISSRSGLVGIPAAAAYASSKAAVRNHTKSVALYCAEQGLRIRCNSVHPAAILTPMWEPMLGDGPEREARARELVREVSLRRFGTAQEVAHLVVYLASDEAAYATGGEFVLDGGILAGTAASPSG